MQISENILYSARCDSLLEFWGQELSVETMKALRNSSQGANAFATLGSDISREVAQAVKNNLVTSGFSAFLERAPEIAPYFEHRLESSHLYLEEVVKHINAYEQQIAQELLGGKLPTRVLSIKPAGAMYRGARSTLVIATDAGTFLYKPHPMPYQAVVSKLCKALLPNTTYLPRVVDCGSACFCEYVRSKPPANEEELQSHYEGLGGFLALAYFLSLSDQHAGNILPVGPALAPIDLETILLAPTSAIESAQDTSKATLNVFSSIISTNMLDYSHDYLAGSIVCGANKACTTTVSSSTEVIEYGEVITQAFTRTFRTCLENKPLLCDAMRSMENVDVRIIIGPNKFYQGLQSLFFKLDGWNEASRLEKFDDILRSPRRKKANEAVFAHEHDVLLEHDIPYFTLRAGGTHLAADGEIIWKDYVSEAPINTAIRHVEDANEYDLQLQLDILRKLIFGMPRLAKKRVCGLPKHAEPLTQAAALDEAALILQRVYDDSLDFGSDGRALLAYSNAYGSYEPMDASLAWGYAGVGCFAAACIAAGVDHANFAHELVDMCLIELDCATRKLEGHPDQLAVGVTLNLKSGLAGHLRALQLIWAATHEERARAVYTNILALLDAADFSSFENRSIVCGLQELARVLSHETPGLPQSACCERIVQALRLRSSCNDSATPAKPAQQNNLSSLPSCDDFDGGNAGIVEKLMAAGDVDAAGELLSALVARRHETGNYIHKGAWRVPYFDPTLFHGATGIGYELVRYAKPDKIESLVV